MATSRQITVLLSLIFFSSVCFAQREKIDSLRKNLPALKDSARIDCLNGLSESYLNLETFDMALYFVSLAYEEATKIGYIHGIAEALSLKARALSDKDNNYPLSEKLSNEAIEWYRKTTNKKGLAELYLNLGFVLYAQSFFTSAIKNLDTAYYWYKKDNNEVGISWVYGISRAVYEESGNYEKAFEFARKNLDMAIQNNNDGFRRYELTIIGDLFRYIGDYEKAFEYYREAFINIKPEAIVDSLNVTRLLSFAELFTHQQEYDSAKYYYHFVDTSGERARRFYLISIGYFYLEQKQYAKALPNFLRGLIYHKQYNDRNQVMSALLAIAATYFAMKNDTAAMKYAYEGLNMGKQTNARQFISDASKILSSVYERWGQPDSAYFYYKQYTAIKDSILNDQVKGKFAAYTFEQKMEVLNKEKEIQQIQLQKLSLLKNILIVGIVLLLLLSIIVFRNIALKRRNEKLTLKHELELQKLESDKKLSEFEMQSLRSQMNPHFIFNSLHSINKYIMENEKQNASEYLSKFAKLMRLVLENSRETEVPLEKDLSALELYMQLEAMRFQQRFKYNIEVDPQIDKENTLIPPLLLQPFVENSIIHGMKNKEVGLLKIKVEKADGMMRCTVEDNGIGREQSRKIHADTQQKHESLGMKITKERLEMISETKKVQTAINIYDLKDAEDKPVGLRIELLLPYEEAF